MKISKLFHWLYASLMLLPLVVFGVTGLYYGLNQNAQLSERTEQQPVYYQTNTVETINDLFTGRAYDYLNNAPFSSTPKPFLQIKETENIYNMVGFHGNADGYYRIDSSTNDVYIYNYASSFYSIVNKHFTFVLQQVLNTTYMTDNIDIVGIATQNIVESYLSIETTNDISTSIINAWNSTWQNPLFSWSSESFLIAPFNYITDLFSIPQNNTFSMALSYWLAISIVYLVFDLVMYVPLLAHRWIDKGMVE